MTALVVIYTYSRNLLPSIDVPQLFREDDQNKQPKFEGLNLHLVNWDTKKVITYLTISTAVS